MRRGVLVESLSTRSAIFSEGGSCRYVLTIRLGPESTTCVWVMANSSTADAEEDDPTTRKVSYFTRLMGFGTAVVLNLCAFRTPYPQALAAAARNGVDVIGPDNERHMVEVLARPEVQRVVFAWGDCLEVVPETFQAARGRIYDLVKREGLTPYCFGRTQRHNAVHPLWLPRSSKPVYYYVDETQQREEWMQAARTARKCRERTP